MAMRGVRRWVAGGSLVGMAGLSAAGGCGGDADCAEDVLCEIRNDDGTSNGLCWGQCVYPREPGWGFEAPVLVWTGPELLAPSSCEDITVVVPGTDAVIRPFAGTPAFVGRTESRPDLVCPKCECAAPSCELPSEVTAFSSYMCGEEPGETRTSFPPPQGWDGACVSPGLVAPEQLGSFSIGPTRVPSCVPVVEEQPVPRDLVVDEVAVACSGEAPFGLCDPPSMQCLLYQPREHLPEPWRQCIVAGRDDAACAEPAAPDDPWPTYSEKLSGFYKVTRDTRECTACACEPPAASRCEAVVSAYQDRACSDFLGSIGVTEEEGACLDPVSGPALGSLSATWVVNEPGRCTATGGTLDGDLDPRAPVTICCLPKGP